MPDDQARVQVVVPEADAQVLFDGNKTTSTGRIRQFDPGPLERGYNYSYRVSATWTENGKSVTEVRVVPVIPGRLSVADFTRPATEQLPAPTKAKTSN